MGAMSTTFTIPCSIDHAVLAVQDCLNQLGWPILEISNSLIVTQGPGYSPTQMYNFPKVSLKLHGNGEFTNLNISVSIVGPMITKSHFAGIMGKLTNSISLRVQTESLLINPTVSIGQGQPTETVNQNSANQRDTAEQLMDLKELLDKGLLTESEFAKEKAKILGN